MLQGNLNSNYAIHIYKFGNKKNLMEISSESIYNSSYASEILNV